MCRRKGRVFAFTSAGSPARSELLLPSVCRWAAAWRAPSRAFFGYPLWQQALATSAELLWRVKANANLPKLKKLPDGSYLTKVYRSVKACEKDVGGIPA